MCVGGWSSPVEQTANADEAIQQLRNKVLDQEEQLNHLQTQLQMLKYHIEVSNLDTHCTSLYMHV